MNKNINTNYLKDEIPLLFTGQDEPSQKSSLFLTYDITKLITLPYYIFFK